MHQKACPSVLIAIAAALVLAIAPAALAAKPAGGGGGGGKGGSGGGDSTSSLSLVLVESTDGLPHWGQSVTFDVQTSAAYPYVTLDCFQGGVRVSTMTAGFYPSYRFTRYYTLSSSSWQSGEADCVANLHTSSSNGRTTTLKTLSFHVYA